MVTRAGTRTAALLAAAALTLLPASGCAAAARVLSVASTATTIADVVDAGSWSTAPTLTGTGGSAVHATIRGTHGAGLRLNRSPGADRLGVLPDGAVVTVRCRATGREVTGPYGPSSGWDLVDAPGGTSGYMSEAYLALDADPASVPPC